MGIWYDKKAYELLKKCSDSKNLTEWNEYRKATNYSPINLRFAELNNFYLQKAELQNVDFRGSTFGNNKFDLADIENSKFYLINYHRTLFLFFAIFGFLITSQSYFFDAINVSFITLLCKTLLTLIVLNGVVIVLS
ncbi:hypothetical protein, partial [Sulfuricurvum sp.]|uniref:hypothetical protein n=1 Tax=Sulfuricurvum sp. TaxID=2025608 RepID=UPI003BB721A3